MCLGEVKERKLQTERHLFKRLPQSEARTEKSRSLIYISGVRKKNSSGSYSLIHFFILIFPITRMAAPDCNPISARTLSQ